MVFPATKLNWSHYRRKNIANWILYGSSKMLISGLFDKIKVFNKTIVSKSLTMNLHGSQFYWPRFPFPHFLLILNQLMKWTYKWQIFVPFIHHCTYDRVDVWLSFYRICIQKRKNSLGSTLLWPCLPNPSHKHKHAQG